MADWNWYLSIAACREYMRIVGLCGECELENPHFARAQAELGELSRTARIVESCRQKDGTLTYRAHVKVNGRSQRIELAVVPFPREEGKLPQLVRVRRK